MKISVVLAAYKGEKYISEQIDSILPQLGQDDELIVSDDFPEGETKNKLLEYDDCRINYIEGPGKGVVSNFEHALKASTGDIIFLCDQDDVWMPDKVSVIMNAFQAGSELVLHNAVITDAELNETGETSFGNYGTNTSLFKNIVRNTFVGCCMAFRREVLEAALPFPDNIPMHDWWIALAAMKKGYKISPVDKPLIKWRRHSSNVTGSKTSPLTKIKWRISIIRHLLTV